MNQESTSTMGETTLRRTRPSTPQQAEHYVDAVAVARFLSLHPRTVMQMARQGDIPAHPLGCGQRRMWRFLLSELDVWMRERVHSQCRPCSPKRREI
jgi:helix-turn-helix protein